MSGTSADGIDAALVRIRGSGKTTRIKLIAHQTYAFPRNQREFILRNSLPGSGSVDILCELNIALAYLFADAVRKIARKARVSLHAIDLIGSHGQTVHHMPQRRMMLRKKVRSTLQIGDPSTIAKLTRIPTVGDFRTADMAVGGQGAPLVPLYDYMMFRSKKRNRLVLNLGGIANITVLPKNCSLNDVRAFDTGPANMVIDALMKKLYGKPYDRSGKTASAGRVISHLLNWMMSNSYFNRPPPKSTGRELFGEPFVNEVLKQARIWAPEDIIATATEFTACSIYRQYKRFVQKHVPADEIIASGGGVHNATLMRRIRQYFAPVPVLDIEKLGQSSDAKEAVLFAVLANETISEHASNVPRATGAKRPVILGKICL